MSDELVHPSAELLSDHRADLLEPDVSRRIVDHVAGCSRCRDQLDALDAAVGRLRDVGRDKVPMPPDVALRLETALAAEARQRAAVVVPMRPANDRDRAAVEHERTSADRHRRRSLILVAAGTVAVLAIGGIAADRTFSGGRTGSSTAGSDASATGRRPGPATGGQLQAKTPQAGNRGATDSLAIDQANFESIAPIAITTGARAGSSSVSCFDAAVRGYHARSWLSASIDWRGVHAWLLYDPAHSRGVVVDCAAGPRIMYEHQF